MRKGFDGLCGLVRNELWRDPLSGDVFIFMNRRRNQVKLLSWESGGLAIYSSGWSGALMSFQERAILEKAWR